MVKRIYFYILIISLFLSSFAFGEQIIPDEAKKHFDRALKIVETSKSREDLKTAVIEFQNAINYAPNWPDAYYNLGMVCDKLERYDCAITNLKKYLDLSPNDPEASEIMQVIENGKQKLEEINRAKKLMTNIRSWKFIESNPKVNIDTPETFVSTEFRFKGNDKMLAKHPSLINFEPPRYKEVRETWSAVEFDGRYFEYRYKVWFKSLNPSGDIKDEYVLRIIRGEIILESPVKIRQKVFFKVSPTLAGKEVPESLIGEAIYELR